MRKIHKICTLLMAVALFSTQAMASDYNFTTDAPQDYYGSTSYEDVYGAQYNYGGQNAVDFLDPLAESIPIVEAGGAVQYGLTGTTSAIAYPDSGGSSFPVQWDESFSTPAIQNTAVSDMMRSDGSIGTLIIPSLKIRYKAYDGTASDSMKKGVGHFTNTSAWNGNIGLCGHNRGSKFNIGAIKDLKEGDVIQYETSAGTRTYAVAFVGVIDWTDWSYLNATTDNRITLITCLADHPTNRVCVQAVEVRS